MELMDRMNDLNRIKDVAVIGAGVMGTGIAQVFLQAEFSVTLVDLLEKKLKKARIEIEQNLKKVESKGKLDANQTVKKLLTNLKISVDLSNAVKEKEFIIEAVPEILELKQEIFQKTSQVAPSSAILASNTSTFPITKLAELAKIPEDVIGMHFFVPVYTQGCVEVMKGKNTSEKAFEIGLKIGEILPCLRGNRLVAPIIVDSPGFIANRLLIPPNIYLNWIFDQAAERGIPWEQIDADAGAGILTPMGPCELADYLGIDSVYNSSKSYEKFLSPDFKPGKVITEMMENGLLGKKSGRGFYDWTRGKPKIDLSKKAGLLNPEMIMAIQLNEGCKMLEERVVRGYKIIEDVMKMGPGMIGPFAPGKKNFEHWSSLLEEFSGQVRKEVLKPCTLMKTGEFKNMR